ncbi:nitric-oxide reductase large subunit [Halalkalicoccus subterraneus]|uniref:nitric-oxide reductase large subunit n=1 Tax=Halalkalicoccus subterraneus TaxID=2675002 RepID=UPI000EFB0C2B|nr:cbb3-type cytochrome c oxidase subunit I [Halalkalicoccus subterraneus]
MAITNFLQNAVLPDRDQPASERRHAKAYVVERLKPGVVDAVPTWVRRTAHDPSSAIERRIESLLKEYEGMSVVDEATDRAFEAFLHQYNLDETRLDDRTVEAIRERVAADARPSESTLAGTLSDVDLSELDLAAITAGDRDGDAFSELLERDAIEFGHQIERALGDASERFEDVTVDGNEGRSIHATEAGAAALAATLLADSGGVSDLGGALAGLLSVFAAENIGGGGQYTGEQVALGALSKLLDGLDEDEIREILGSETTGARALVALFVANLVAMGLGAWFSKRHAPPIPEEFRGPDNDVVFTAEQVRAGKKAFQANGLMNQGSILGNGSYFGVDLTADALELKAHFMREYYARERGTDSLVALDEDEQAAVEHRVETELDGEAPDGPIAEYSAAETYAHQQIRETYIERYHEGDPERGIPEGFVRSVEQAARIADFACWTAWISHTNRPGSDHSYTNDWPYVSGTGNRPTGQVLVWSTISLVLLVASGGLGVWAYHTFDFAEPTTEMIEIPSPDKVASTATQYAAAWYVPVAGALFLVQTLTGALLAHYYIERTGFFGIADALGIDIVSLLPFATVRTWHVNLAVLWITTLWLAGGLFLPGLFSDDDPPWQTAGTTTLLGLLVTATVGAFAGVWLGIHGKLGTPEDGDLWWLIGSEGLEYLEVGRLWKLLLLAGFVGWTGLVIRGVRRVEDSPAGLGHFMAYAGGSIALLFGASMLYTPETNIAVTEFWRWWVVHMWVEGVFEFFVTAVISVALVSMELVDQGDAEKAILFEVFTIMGAGIVGVSHHYWWVGLPDVWVPLGTTFSTLEFIPLVFVLYRSLGEYRSLRAQGEDFPYTIPFLFIIASSVWNFVGGGVLGFFINLPVINYYEHGTYLTVAHAHAAMFGAFGLLALGLGTYILRVVTPENAWDPAWFRGAFWLTNIGLAIMTFASLLPVGFAQLKASYSEGYAVARSLEFYERPRVQALLWVRTLGDTPMILGALAFTVGAVKHVYAARGDRKHQVIA